MNAWERLRALLAARELEEVRELVERAPATAAAAIHLVGPGLLWVGAKLDGELAGWLLSPAADEADARVMGESLCALLAQAYGPLREARATAAEAIRKASH